MGSQALFQLLTGPGVVANKGAKAFEAVDQAVGVVRRPAGLGFKEIEAGEVRMVGIGGLAGELILVWASGGAA